MSRLRRTLGTLGLGVVIGSCAVPATAADVSPRVRSTSGILRAVIVEASDASPQFRTLIRAIDTTDGIVYVEEGVCRHSVRACLVHGVTNAGGFRFLRVLIDIHGVPAGSDRLELMGTIGHELWHALEVLRDRNVTSAAGMFDLYVREAPTVNDAFETAAAVAIGNRIRDEVAAAPQTARSKVVGQLKARDETAGN